MGLKLEWMPFNHKIVLNTAEVFDSILTQHRVLKATSSHLSFLAPVPNAQTRRAVLTGWACELWHVTFTCSTLTHPSTVTQLLVCCHAGSGFHGAAAVFTSPVVITNAVSTLAPPVPSTYSVG